MYHWNFSLFIWTNICSFSHLQIGRFISQSPAIYFRIFVSHAMLRAPLQSYATTWKKNPHTKTKNWNQKKNRNNKQQIKWKIKEKRKMNGIVFGSSLTILYPLSTHVFALLSLFLVIRRITCIKYFGYRLPLRTV